jgi:hypothetical protein
VLAALSRGGALLRHSTYLGGSDNNSAFGIALCLGQSKRSSPQVAVTPLITIRQGGPERDGSQHAAVGKVAGRSRAARRAFPSPGP